MTPSLVREIETAVPEQGDLARAEIQKTSTRAYAGIDVAVAKNKRLPVSVCVRREGRVEPLPLRRRDAPLPPKLPGNLAILVLEVRRRLAIETADYLHRVEHHFDVRICRIAIDAPRRPRLATSRLRQCEAALGKAGISYIQTPDEETFERIPKDVAAYQLDTGSRTGLPHANRIWMLFGFELFAALTAEGWPCIEVYPQATVQGLGAGERHKKRPGAVLEQVTAASARTGWPARPSLDELRAIAFGSLDDCLDAYLSAWVASLPEDACEALGNPPDDVIWRPAGPVARFHV